MTRADGDSRVFINSVLGTMNIHSAISVTDGYVEAKYGFRADTGGVNAAQFKENDRGYAMCGHVIGHTYHCDWDETNLWFQVDDTWVWNSSDKRLKKNIDLILKI